MVQRKWGQDSEEQKTNFVEAIVQSHLVFGSELEIIEATIMRHKSTARGVGRRGRGRREEGARS
jgi:hypothetical protein